MRLLYIGLCCMCQLFVVLRPTVAVPEEMSTRSKYIVQLKKGVVTTNINGKYQNVNIGDYNVLLVDSDDVLENIKKLDIMLDYENDTIVSNTEYQWGIDRLDQKKLPLNKNYNPVSRGTGMYVYVLDTGVNKNHDEFEGRVDYGMNVFNNGLPIDGHGHGTHVMSTVLGKTVGVVNKANGVAVKVLSNTGSGTVSGVIKGVEWAVNHINTRKRCGVISMSLGGGKSTSLNNAINAAVKAGVNVVVAAGNSNTNACYSSPASAEDAITVGSTTISDGRSWFSNYGKCTDIFAPGSDIVGANYLNKNTYTTMSGTSMACPHVAGISLMVLENNKCMNVDLKKQLQKLSSSNMISGIPRDTVNMLANIDNIVKAKPTPNPTAAPTRDCTEECNGIKSPCYCWLNKKILNNGKDCMCKWDKTKDIKCIPYVGKTRSPKPDISYPNCRRECKTQGFRCGCLLNNKIGNKCKCKWDGSRNKCFAR